MASSIQVTVKQTEPMTVAFIGMWGPYTQIPEAFGKLYQWIGQKGYVPSGPPLGLYLNAPGQIPEDQLLWELRSPIAGDVALSEPDEQGLGVKHLAAIQVASTMHKGPFEKVEETYKALAEWVVQNGYEMSGPPEEVYFSNPAETRPEDLLTEIRFPVRKK